MPSLEQEIQDPNRFKEFYQFCFNYGKANNPGQKGKKYIFSKYIYLFEIILESIILIYFRCGHRCCISLLEPHTPRKISTPWYMDNICQGNLNLTISQHTYKSLTQGTYLMAKWHISNDHANPSNTRLNQGLFWLGIDKGQLISKASFEVFIWFPLDWHF